MSLKKAAARIKRSASFLITAHTNLEGDALGAQLAFYRLVKTLGKRACIVNEDAVPYGYGFLPGTDKIIRYKDNLKVPDFDCFAILDCSGLKRCGEVYRLNKKGAVVLNIDHHISNEQFGDTNWVEPHASSACEMVYRLYKELRVPVDKEAALALYTGILTDTGSFRYSNTSAFVHQAVAQLLRHKIDVPAVYQNIYGNIPRQDMLLLAKVLPRMHFAGRGKVVYFSVARNLIRGKKIVFDLSESILNFGRSVKDAEVVVLFKENLGNKNEVRVNFRSQGRVDVNKIAAYFGGGGHRTASAATIIGRLSDIRKRVLARIVQAL
jgi:phosphoesterase RecJ-like protein